MFVSDSHKLVYLAPPKTGTVSMAHFLRGEPYLARQIDGPTHTHHDTVWDPAWQDYYLFMTVRHPYTRAVSFWRYACARALQAEGGWRNAFRPSFGDDLPNLAGFFYLPSSRPALRTFWSCAWHRAQMPRQMHKVVRFERFAAELAEIPALNLRTPPHLNHGVYSNRPWYQFMLDCPESLELIQQTWPDDFEQFGYTRDLDACIRGEFFVGGAD